MLEVFHKHGLKVITDLVLSHTSDEHPWFVESQKAKIQNIVIGMYGLMAKKAAHQIIGYQFLVEVRGNGASIIQFYLHNLTSQPDLNFHNPEVQAQMLDEIKFWLDVGGWI